MVWPLVASAYVAVGGVAALALVPAGRRLADPRQRPFNPARAFVFVVGTIALWPLVVALIADEAGRS